MADALIRGWRCWCCGTHFIATDDHWNSRTGFRCAPSCPQCKAFNQYTHPTGHEGLLDKIEHMGFSCEAGPLSMSQEWGMLRDFVAAALSNIPPSEEAGNGAR